MLKLTLKRNDGIAAGWEFNAGDVSILFSLVEPDPTPPGEPPDAWRLYVLQGSCSDFAASLLHGLELGVSASARWIVVELLKDPAPPAEDERAEGAALWLKLAEKHSPALFTVMSSAGELGVVGVSNVQPMHAPGTCWWYSCSMALVSVGQRAAQEQALAALIEHAAPWIALELVKEARAV
jgi:hypothetical protein